MTSVEKNKSWAGGGSVPTATEDDGKEAEVVRAELQGYDSGSLVWRRVAVDGTGQVKTTGGGGGGGPSTIADGADVAEGATTDGAVVTDTSGTVSGKLRGLVKWAFERMPASLGQKTMATSLPVVLSSDQSSIPVAATLAAETTKVIGTVNQGTSPWVTNDPGLADTLGQKTMAGSAAVVLASDQASIPVTASWAAAQHVIVDTAPSTAVTGPLTDTQLRASAVPVSNATLPLPAGAATEATLAGSLGVPGDSPSAYTVLNELQRLRKTQEESSKTLKALLVAATPVVAVKRQTTLLHRS